MIIILYWETTLHAIHANTPPNFIIMRACHRDFHQIGIFCLCLLKILIEDAHLVELDLTKYKLYLIA